MNARDQSDYLTDILESIDDIKAFTQGMQFESFASKKKPVKAVIRSVGVIGETAGNIPGEFKARYPAVP